MKPPDILRSSTFRLLCGALFCVLMAACLPTSSSQGTPLMSAKYPATAFFRGHYLEMAKAIEAGDIPLKSDIAVPFGLH